MNESPVSQQWNKLEPGPRAAIAALAVVETGLKVAMLIDLHRRPDRRVRGPKWLWRLSTLVGSAGLLPLGYFVFGRR